MEVPCQRRSPEIAIKSKFIILPFPGDDIIDINAVLQDENDDTWLYNPSSSTPNATSNIENTQFSELLGSRTYTRPKKRMTPMKISDMDYTYSSNGSVMTPSLLDSDDFDTSLLNSEISCASVSRFLQTTPLFKNQKTYYEDLTKPSEKKNVKSVLYRRILSSCNEERTENCKELNTTEEIEQNNVHRVLKHENTPKSRYINYGTYRKTSPLKNTVLNKYCDGVNSIDSNLGDKRNNFQLLKDENHLKYDHLNLNETYKVNGNIGQQFNKMNECNYHENTNINSGGSKNDNNNNNKSDDDTNNGDNKGNTLNETFQVSSKERLDVSFERRSDENITIIHSTPSLKKSKAASVIAAVKPFDDTSSSDESSGLFSKTNSAENIPKTNNMMNISYIEISPKNHVSKLPKCSMPNPCNIQESEEAIFSRKSEDNLLNCTYQKIEDELGSNASDSGLSSASYNCTSISDVQNLARLQERNLTDRIAMDDETSKQQRRESSDDLLSDGSDIPYKEENSAYLKPAPKQLTNHSYGANIKKRVVTKTIQTSYSVGNGVPYKYQNNIAKNVDKTVKAVKVSTTNKAVCSTVRNTKPPTGQAVHKVTTGKADTVKPDMPPPAPKFASKPMPSVNQQSASNIPRPYSRIPMPRFKS